MYHTHLNDEAQMKKKIVAKHTEAPQMSVTYPTADELRAFGARCNALGDAVKAKQGFLGVAAVRCAIDLDYLSRLVDANPVKNIGQWDVVITAAKPQKSKPRT